MSREKAVDDTVAKLRFLCGSRSTYPVSSSVTNADVMALIDALDGAPPPTPVEAAATAKRWWETPGYKKLVDDL